ncbi:hypothetical protein P175DRAFT_0440707, partial [Aspergillus ochraceoroseus IBT 24754]
PASGLSTAERTGSPIFHFLWSYVLKDEEERLITRSPLMSLAVTKIKRPSVLLLVVVEYHPRCPKLKDYYITSSKVLQGRGYQRGDDDQYREGLDSFHDLVREASMMSLLNPHLALENTTHYLIRSLLVSRTWQEMLDTLILVTGRLRRIGQSA